MSHQLIGLAGASTFETTDAQGNAILRLPVQTRAGDPVTLQLFNTDLVLISPTDGRTHVPSFEEKPGNFIAVVIAKKGDADLLKNGDVIRALMEKVLASIRKIELENAKATPEILRKVLDEHAAEYGHGAADFDKVIRTLPDAPVTMADKDLAARYLTMFPRPIQQISGGAVVVTGGSKVEGPIITGSKIEGSIINQPQNSPITIQQRQHDTDSALSVIARAVASRPTGDIGEIAATEHLVSSKSSLAGMDLAGLSLAGSILDQAQFSETVLTGANLLRASLRSADLREARVDFANLEEAHLESADLTSTRLYFTIADKAVCERVKAAQSNWLAASVRSANFRGADLHAANFAYADLSDAIFDGADLTDAVFAHAILKGTSFASAVIKNTDFTGAVADPSVFSDAQRHDVCGSAMDRGVGRVELIRVVKSTRFDSGEAYDDLAAGDIPVLAEEWMLEPCKRRTRIAAGHASVWTGIVPEQVLTEYRLAYPAELLDKGQRERKFEERLRDQLARLRSATANGRLLVILGPTHAAMLRAIEKNVKNTVPLSAPELYDNETLALLIVRERPELTTEHQWLRWARDWLSQESRKRNDWEGPNPWPRFFPDGYSAEQLGPEHARVFRQWTLDRARHIPAEFSLSLEPRIELASKLGEIASIHLTPLTSRGQRREVPANVLQRIGAVDGYRIDSSLSQYTVFAFKHDLTRVGFELSVDESRVLSRGETKADVRVRLLRVDVLKEGEASYAVFLMDILAMSIVHDGRVVRLSRTTPIIEEKKPVTADAFLRQLCAQFSMPIPSGAELLRNTRQPDIESVKRDLASDPDLGKVEAQMYVVTLLKQHPRYADILADYLIANMKARGETDVGPYLGELYKRMLDRTPRVDKPAECR